MFLSDIHYIRGVAIVMIVSGHMIRFFNWDQNQLVEKFLKTVLTNGTVLFVFVAGYLFQYLSDRYTYKRYLLKKFLYVILPYFLISIPMIIYLVYVEQLGHWAHPGLNERSPIYQIYWFYISGKHLAPLWFIPMITVIYILYPGFRLIDRNEHIYYFIIPLSLVIAALSHRPQSEVSIPHTLLYFCPVYLFGMFCSHNRSTVLGLIIKHHYRLILVFIVLIFIEMFFYNHHGIIYVKDLFYHDKEVLDINLFQKLVLCLLLVGGFTRLNTKFKHSKLEPALNLTAVFSFGIYFLHYYFYELFVRFRRIYDFNINGNIINVAAITICVLVFCILSIKLLKAFMGKQSQFIIGC